MEGVLVNDMNVLVVGAYYKSSRTNTDVLQTDINSVYLQTDTLQWK